MTLSDVVRDCMDRQGGLGTHQPARSAVHAVLNLHQPGVYPGYSKRSKRRHCVECYGYDGEHGGRIVEYPCPTVEAVCEAFGIDPRQVGQ